MGGTKAALHYQPASSVPAWCAPSPYAAVSTPSPVQWNNNLGAKQPHGHRLLFSGHTITAPPPTHPKKALPPAAKAAQEARPVESPGHTAQDMHVVVSEQLLWICKSCTTKTFHLDTMRNLRQQLEIKTSDGTEPCTLLTPNKPTKAVVKSSPGYSRTAVWSAVCHHSTGSLIIQWSTLTMEEVLPMLLSATTHVCQHNMLKEKGCIAQKL
ncbi:hypothetical protein E2C01_033827 [Portunus trituberculatus]|uniref:Uncharacterized protein n=1 Tax=Portunus trituberculatus TaxID=210409 RepID=A0A5B7EZV9_PORTR|nr:hypothetical protein [Portunus trituberculatus]